MTRNHACEAFATTTDVYASPLACGLTPGADDAFVLALIDQASDMLAFLSGGRMSGRCRSTLWPVFREGSCWPVDASGVNAYQVNEVLRYGFRTIPLWGPKLEVIQVAIDGVVINPSQYKLVDGTDLVRLSGEWPTSNDLRLADGAPGTFTITIQVGEAPDELARQACVELVAELAQDELSNGDSNLPAGARSTNLQGVSVELEDRAAALRENASTLPRVLRFLAIHANGGRLPPTVESPELGEGWRFHTRTGASGS